MDIDHMISLGESKQGILVEIRKATGMTRKALSEYFGIPYRSMQDWERGERQMPDYLLRLMSYKLESEGLIESQDSESEHICKEKININ